MVAILTGHRLEVGEHMGSMKKTLAGVAVMGAVASMIAFAPVAAADTNYAPDLPKTSTAGESFTATVTGAQPKCRVTYTVRRVGTLIGSAGRLSIQRVRVGADGEASVGLVMPSKPGVYSVVTRVDNFPGETGCTPTISTQRVTVE